MKEQRILRIGEALLFALILSIPSAVLASSPSATPALVSISITNNTSTLPSSGYQIMVWRYAETGGAPTLAASTTANAGTTVQLSDPGLSSFYHYNPSVHYSLLVMLSLPNRSIIQLCNYHWGSPVTGSYGGLGGNVVSTESVAIALTSGGMQLAVNGQSVPYQVTKPSPNSQTGNMTTGKSANLAVAAPATSSQMWPITVLHPANQGGGKVSPDSPNGCFFNGGLLWYYCWVKVATFQSLPTTIGEATGSGYMGDTFAYGQSSGSTLSVDASANGGSWSVSGTYTWTNQNSAATTWPTLQCCWNWYIQTMFNYEEDQLEWCPLGICGQMQSSYQIWASGWDGGAEPWTPEGGTAGPSSSPPGDCLAPSSLPNVYSYALYAPNSGFTYDAANGYSYSWAVSITAGMGIVGTSATAGISDTTSYNQHTTQTITFGNHYSAYYLYTNGLYSSVLKWPVIFSTNNAAHCGP